MDETPVNGQPHDSEHPTEADHSGQIDQPSHEQIREWISAYVLGALEPEEIEQVELHLESCASCRAVVAEERRIALILPYLAESQPVPLRARRRLMQRVEAIEEQTDETRAGESSEDAAVQIISRRRHIPAGLVRLGWAVAAVAVIVLGVFVWNNVQMQAQVASKNKELSVVQQQQHTVTKVLSSQNGVSTTLQNTGVAPGADGGIIVNPNENFALVVVEGMPKLPVNENYVVWLMRGTQPVNQGILPINEQGHGQLYVHPSEALSTFTGVLITEESNATASIPTGVRMLSAQVSAP